MKSFNNANHLTKTTLAALACVAFVGCTDPKERVETTSTTSSTTAPADSTYSNTTIAADDTPKTLDTTGAVPPAPADTATGSEMSESSTTTETKTTKKMKHKAKKAHKKHSAWVAPAPAKDDVAVFEEEDTVYGPGYVVDDSMDVSDQYENETVSATTMAPETYRETGLSPFAQEPNSRMPKQIGSGQLTGEDKSTTILEGPSLFQDPSALGRDLIR